ncbi:hypothetical protein GSI_02244 [Ganoderma sinense ZZ0214-1]|uniref:Telomerase reverse transcriptase n=1 Tax=Ganoderma sinense ZZ0214-1 TaxID=1077348 RepID=A0A2G8SP11_9APHY|nr:hypothetical protein GSI_02244 [Ganoderma sinense ZZ0214-1]
MVSLEDAAQTNPALLLLKVYYPVVSTLQAYLGDILNTQAFNIQMVRDDDATYYKALLQTSYVASRASPGDLKCFVPTPPMSHMRDVIDRAQEKLFFRAKSGKPSNIITAGYRKVNQQDSRSKIGASRVPLTNYFVNTMVTALQAQEWETLLQRIGEDAMFHLLTETSIFASLPNGCLCQMVGDPVLHMKPPIPAPRRNSEEGRGPEGDIDIPHVAFQRARMFYSRPSFVPHTAKIIIGLPPKHVLNGFHPAWHSNSQSISGVWVDPDPRQQMERARHLAKYIFPRQYELSNPFSMSSSGRYGSFRMPDYLDREQEIKNKGSCKTPKRLKHVLDILEKMIWRHYKCKYKMLLDMELMSETSIQLQTQPSLADTSVSLDSSGRPIIAHISSQARKHSKYKPRFAEFAAGATEVFRYAVVVTKTVVPKAFWGSDHNFEVVMRRVPSFSLDVAGIDLADSHAYLDVKHMITARRYETSTVHNVLQGFRTTDCDWLMPHTPGARKQSRVSVTDSLKRRELAEEFLFWYFDGFLIPLLKTTFYVTESSAFRNRVLYFRHDDWYTLCTPLVQKLSTDTFRRIDQLEAQEILRQRKLGFSFVRLLPKETGDPFKSSQSINQILQAAFQILTYEKERQPESLGASVFGPNEIYTKLKAFKTRLTSGNPKAKLPKLYFVKVDVQACFDTIEQTKLLSILRDLISEDTYMIQRYGTVNKAGEKVQRKYVKKAMPEDDHPHFLAYATQLADVLRNTVFVDQVVYPYSRRQEIIALLEEHITENLVKIGNEYYRQVVGIPQGSVLSAILCSFFYGDLERRMFKFTDDLECCLIRLIDDWLLITTSLVKANRFYDMVSQGHPEYGCFISKDKSLLNFDHPELANIVDPRSKIFPWCGYSIDMSDLSVTADYTRYHETYLQDSLTVEYGRRPGAAFAYKMMQLAKSKSHIIYNDAELNSREAIYVNLYQNFAVLAMKMHHYLRQWGLNIDKSHTFIMRTIRQTIRFSYTSLCQKATHKLATKHGARIVVEKLQATWLGIHAFHTVFSRKPHSYARLLKSLRFDLSLPKYRLFKKQYRGVIAEGLSTLTLLSF